MTFIKQLLAIPAVFLIVILSGCEPERSNNSWAEKKRIDDSIAKAEDIADFVPEIKYKLVHIENRATIDSLFVNLPDTINIDSAKKIIRTLNRKELRLMRDNEQIIVPEYFTNNVLDYSIFPHRYHAAKEIEKIIMVSIDKQAYGCYEYGKLVRFAATNSGKERTPSFPGRYALVWRDRLRKSSLDSHWVLPFTFNFHSEAGSAFHQFSMPGRPVSHSCLRQLEDDAEWLFKWGKGAKRDTNGRAFPMTGTPLILLGYFDYTRPKGGPWLDFKSNKDGLVELPDKPLEVEEALIPIIQIPKSSRGSLRNREAYVTAEETLRKRGVIREGIVLTPSVDFNKQRRLRKAAEHKRKIEEEQKKKESEVQPVEETSTNDESN